MDSNSVVPDAKSTADIVFEQLFEEIVTLKLLPGAKISEAEVARRFGVSRQPIRDAFRRLGNLDLLNIRPQRATLVRRFSLDDIANARFVRLAVELEVIERACQVWDQPHAEALAANFAEQAAALDLSDPTRFHDLDYDFHKIICVQSGQPMAFDTIIACKRKVDRLCVLSLSRGSERADVLDDHRAIVDALERRNTKDARFWTRKHLSRLDKIVAEIHETHTSYFQ